VIHLRLRADGPSNQDHQRQTLRNHLLPRHPVGAKKYPRPGAGSDRG